MQFTKVPFGKHITVERSGSSKLGHHIASTFGKNTAKRKVGGILNEEGLSNGSLLPLAVNPKVGTSCLDCTVFLKSRSLASFCTGAPKDYKPATKTLPAAFYSIESAPHNTAFCIITAKTTWCNLSRTVAKKSEASEIEYLGPTRGRRYRSFPVPAQEILLMTAYQW